MRVQYEIKLKRFNIASEDIKVYKVFKMRPNGRKYYLIETQAPDQFSPQEKIDNCSRWKPIRKDIYYEGRLVYDGWLYFVDENKANEFKERLEETVHFGCIYRVVEMFIPKGTKYGYSPRGMSSEVLKTY